MTAWSAETMTESVRIHASLLVMVRADRVASLLEALRATDVTTVPALAMTLGVSGRTVRRDLATLRGQGHAITGESGRGGGLRLEGGRGITSVQLSLEEVVTLWLSARVAERTGALPWSSAAVSALRKLLASLPASRARPLRELARRIIIGPAPTRAMQESAGPVPREALALVEQAFTTRTALSFHYRTRHGTKSERRVEPHGLLLQSPLCYLLAVDLELNAQRMFRLDRCSAVRRLPDVSFAPRRDVISSLLEPGFDWRPLLG
jgi:predicted DNA-binding transcriptional regulator YafY